MTINNALPITELLLDIVDNRGKTVPIVDSGFPLIATNCIKHNSIYPTFENVRYVDQKTRDTWFRAHPKPNDIIFVNKGTPGRVCLVPEPVPFCFAQDMMGFRCDPRKIDYQYLFTVLRSDFIQKTIENFHVGLVIPHFKKSDLANLKIPRLATRKLERTIGELYLSISKKIEFNNSINIELEAMSKTLYDYWFVQFDFPNEDGKPYKTSGGKMVYNEELKREIPTGWEVERLIDIANVSTGRLDSNAGSRDGIYPFFTCSKEPSKIDSYSFDDDVILVAGNNAQGNFHINRYSGKFNAYQRTYVITAKENKHLSYIYQVLFEQMKLYKNRGKGSQTKFLTIGMLTDVPMFKPSLELMSDYYKFTKPLYAKQMNIINENENLELLRDWLLPMLINGQVTVK